jgi:hypothetical protein
MNYTLKLLKFIVHELRTPNNEAIKMSLNNVHAPGLFSLVVSGSEHGKLTRIFIADNTIKPFDIQLHTHRYPIRLTAIKGKVLHHTAVECEAMFETVNLAVYEYKSALSGGFGLKYEKQLDLICRENLIPHGGQTQMGINDFHTVSCSKGSIWIVEELGFETDKSRVLGIPFVLDSLYTKPEMFQINDKHSIVLRELNQIIKNYESL